MTLPLAGRELDELIAERVFGLVRGDDFGERPLHDWRDALDDEWNGVMCHRCNDYESWTTVARQQSAQPGPCDKSPRDYSTSISAAWTVVERLGVRGFEMHKMSDGYAVVFGGGPTAEGETAPLAICRAALLAVGGRG